MSIERLRVLAARIRSERDLQDPFQLHTRGLVLLLLVMAMLEATPDWAGTPARPEAGKPIAGEQTLYTCGMHPQIIQDHPGNCPICGMTLTPIRKRAGTLTATNNMATAESTTITVDPATMQNMNLRTAEIVRGPLRRVIRTVAVIDYDETMLADVTTKFKGWLEKLYVDATGRHVHRGDPLFEVYSPELYSAQTEYVLALSAAAKPSESFDQTLLASARLKLKFFDISDAQIAELGKTRQPKKTLQVTAPLDGFVVEKTAIEGMMAEAGMKLYRLADLGIVWVYAQVYEQDFPYVQLGQEATMTLTYLPDRKFRGRVTFIYPTVDEKTRTVRVRVEFHNPGYYLKPGMFATAELIAELAPAVLLVPDSAVLRSGARNTVFVALPGGRFAPRVVSLGLHAEDDRLQVLGGLQEGERVVTSGQFLLDSESQLQEAIQKMLGPGKAAAATPANARETSQRPQPSPAEGTAEPVLYVCPMPEHVSIEYDHPGKCPLCGMALVPVTKSALEKLQPGGRLLYYTCPMPEHSAVRLDKPGKCPQCGMTLIPVMSPPNVGEASSPPAQTVTSDAHPALYTCSMAGDADVVWDKPGKCPKCGMDLAPTSTVPHGRIAEENWRKQHAHPPH